MGRRGFYATVAVNAWLTMVCASVSNLLQVLLAAKAFGIDLVDFFGAGWPCREPTTLGHHFDTTDRLAIARRVGEDGLNLLPRQAGALNAFLAHFRQHRLLLGGRVGVRAVVQRITELLGEVVVNFARIFLHRGGDLRRQQRGDDTVLIGRPHGRRHGAEKRSRRSLRRQTRAFRPGDRRRNI